MNKILRTMLFFLFIGFLIGGVFMQYFTSFQLGVFESIVYWWVLIVWVSLIWKFKLKADVSFFIAIVILCIAILIKIFGFFEMGEKIARLSLIGFIIGFIQALKEYHKNH